MLAACSASGAGPRRGEESSGGASAAGAGSGAAAGTTATGGTTSFGGFGGAAGTGTGGAGTGPVGTPLHLDDCVGADGPTLAALEKGGPAGALRWLYPYDKTIFPRGLLPPLMQWDPPAATDAVLVRITSALFDYRGCFGPTAGGRLELPAHVWDAATSMASGVGDPLKVELTTLAGGVAAGPVTELWAVAPASLKGAVYYNTYSSPAANNKGAVLRLVPGATQPEVYLAGSGSGCVSCHSLSANGQKMVAASHGLVNGSASYDVGAHPGANPPPLAPTLDEAGFAALYPDGSRLLTTGSPGSTPFAFMPIAPGNVPGMLGPRTSRLFDTVTGAQLPASGWSVQYAKMPTFSPDGRHVVFNHHEASGGHTLATMDFDAATNSFSGYRDLFFDAGRFPGWPFFTPDSKGVVFALGASDDFASAPPARSTPSPSDLWYVDVASRQAVPLAATQSGLPRPGRDEHWDYFPTMSPVAAGGYFWLFFTSRRTWGNTVTADAKDPTTKKIWVTAIEIDALPGSDPSHAPFFLPGQELGAGNKRAFAALEPCRGDGASCATGVDCCCGACNEGVCGCPEGCSKTDEICVSDADCCEPSQRCIAGYCAVVVK